MQASLNINVEIQKINDISTNNSLQQNNQTVEKDSKFNDYLKKEKTVNQSMSKDTLNSNGSTVSKKDSQSTNNDEVEEVKEIDGKVENLSKDDILQCLQALVNALNQANLTKESNINLNEKVDMISKISSSISDSLMNTLNLKNGLNQGVLGNVTSITANDTNSNANLDPASLINNLLELLNSNNAGELLDKKSLTITQSLLNQLGLKLEDNKNATSNVNTINNINSAANLDINDNSFIQDLMSQVKDKVNALLDSKTDKEVLNSNNINGLMISNENVKSSDVKETNNILEKSNTVATDISTYENSNEKSGYESKKDSNTNLSKDDKILKSILGEDSKETPKLSILTTNTVSNGNAEAIKNVQVVNKDTLAADVVKSVKYMASNDIKEMIVKVNPGNLGEITIKLVEEDGNMKLNIKASAKETYNLLSQQTAEIKSHLSNQNIKIQEVNIGVYEDDTTFYKDGQFQNNFSQGENRRENSGTNKSGGESYLEDESAEPEIEEVGNINMLA